MKPKVIEEGIQNLELETCNLKLKNVIASEAKQSHLLRAAYQIASVVPACANGTQVTPSHDTSTCLLEII